MSNTLNISKEQMMDLDVELSEPYDEMDSPDWENEYDDDDDESVDEENTL